MPFCPICKSEYEKGIEFCSDCGSKLVDKLDCKPEVEYDKEAYLTNVADEIQAEIVISKLSTYNIPVLKKYKESGSFMAVYMGNTLFGIDLYVPGKLLEKAKVIIYENIDIDNENIEFDEMMNDFGFEDIDNFEFEDTSENNDKKNLYSPTDNVAIPNNSAKEDKSSIIDLSEHRNNIMDKPSKVNSSNDILPYRRNAKKLITTVILLILIPIVIVTLFALSQLLP